MLENFLFVNIFHFRTIFLLIFNNNITQEISNILIKFLFFFEFLIIENFM